MFIFDETAERLGDEGRIDVGRHTYGSPTILWWGEDARLDIGAFSSIADGVTIFLGGNHRPDWVTTFPFSALPGWGDAVSISGHPATRGNVKIGNDVWIGRGATILSGVTIADGAVVGAGAVVTKNVAPYAIVAGTPAKAVRTRFDAATIAALLDLKWWTWTDDRIRAQVHLLMQDDIGAFLEANGGKPRAGASRVKSALRRLKRG